MNRLKKTVVITVALFAVAASVAGGQNQRRNRGEIFYHCMSANTPGMGNIWLDLSAVGHIWDDSPLTTDTSASAATAVKRRWVSNIRAFPEVRMTAGVTDFIAVDAESRVLSYGFEPGFFSAGLRATWPDNKDLRLNGYALSVMYKYIVRERGPSLGGYTGFMPEGFGIKGNNIEARALYELDILPVQSRLPVRLCVNAGFRLPLDKRQELWQTLFDATAVYSGHGFDFFAGYTVESFTNMFSPIEIEQGGKRFLVWFGENPMYFNLGGNMRYENGVTLSMTVPLLLSVNHGSRMRRDDMVELIHHQSNGIFTYEKDRGVRDPFDPWFVKWKVAGTLTIPLRFRMTGAEMMRNYLLLKNRREQKVIDIDSRMGGSVEPSGKAKAEENEDDRQRLEKIRKKREELSQ